MLYSYLLHNSLSSFKKKIFFMPLLVWLSGLSSGLKTIGLLVGFPARAHAWVVGQVFSRGQVRSNHTLMYLCLSFSLPSPLSKNKIFFKNCIYLLLERGEMREKERERSNGVREIHKSVASVHAPKWGPGPKAWHVPQLGIKLVPLLLVGQHSIC